MTDPGRQTMLALNGIRALLHEVHALMAETARLLDRRGWVDASPSRKASHLGNAWNQPQDWLPRYLYRWYMNPEHPTVLLALVVHLEERDGVPSEPWVVLGAYVDSELGPALSTRDADTYAAGLHLEGEEETASGTVITVDLDQGSRLSIAVPLLEMDGPEALLKRLIEPMLRAL